MKGNVLTLGFLLCLAVTLRSATAQEPQGIPPAPPLSNPVLEVPPLVKEQPRASATPAPEKISAAFFGCWEGRPNGFDSNTSLLTIGSPGRIVFCYDAEGVRITDARIHFGVVDWVKNVLVHLGVGIAWVSVNLPAEIGTRLHNHFPNRVETVTYIPLHTTELLFWCLPLTETQSVVEEEIATMDGPDSILIQARQEHQYGSVRTWHATFHRVTE